jgi:dTDP-4-dehydrorhamnose reductase
MKVAVLGASGQVGKTLLAMRWPADVEIIPLGRAEIDLASGRRIVGACEAYAPDVIVNAAAYTAVDRAESEPAKAFAVNAEGPGYVAMAAERVCAALIHLSTDYVFDGRAREPYREDAPVHPLNVYGASKLLGEERVRTETDRHIILRTSWLFSSEGQNFVKTMLRLGRERPVLRVVDDQVGCPTAASEIARAIRLLVAGIGQGTSLWGTFHLCCPGPATWYEFANAIFEASVAAGARRPVVRPVGTADYPTPAVRPAYSVLDCRLIEKCAAVRLRPWQELLPRIVFECHQTLLGASGTSSGRA